jgi:hypothetical protein
MKPFISVLWRFQVASGIWNLALESLQITSYSVINDRGFEKGRNFQEALLEVDLFVVMGGKR